MHALLFTLLVVGGANGGPVEEGPAPKSAGTVMAGDAGYGGGYCDQCNGGGRHGHHGHHGGARGDRRGMPQSCYDPRYGCYGSNSRMVQRYPAFHGTYYRRPYNYRNLFDYPWHADLHEPTSMFSYNVVAEQTGAIPGGAAVPPAVNPSSTSGMGRPSSVIASPPATTTRR